MSDILKCDYELKLDSNPAEAEFELELEEITEARPLKPLELVEPVRVELAWPVRIGARPPGLPPRPSQFPSRPIPGQLWMGTSRVTPRQRRLRRRQTRSSLARLFLSFLALFVTQS